MINVSTIIPGLQARDCGTHFIHASENRYESCKEFLANEIGLPDEDFDEITREKAVEFLQWAMSYDLAYTEPLQQSLATEELIHRFKEIVEQKNAHCFAKVDPEEDDKSPTPWYSWTSVFDATFEFAIVVLTSEGCIMIVIQDED